MLVTTMLHHWACLGVEVRKAGAEEAPQIFIDFDVWLDAGGGDAIEISQYGKVILWGGGMRVCLCRYQIQLYLP